MAANIAGASSNICGIGLDEGDLTVAAEPCAICHRVHVFMRGAAVLHKIIEKMQEKNAEGLPHETAHVKGGVPLSDLEESKMVERRFRDHAIYRFIIELEDALQKVPFDVIQQVDVAGKDMKNVIARITRTEIRCPMSAGQFIM